MKFRRERRKLFRIRFLTFSQWLLGPLIVTSVLFDLIKRPDELEANLVIRAAVLAVALGLAQFQKTYFVIRKFGTLPMHLLTFFMSLAVCALGEINGYSGSVYLLKLNVILILSFCIMPWSAVGFATSLVTILGPLFAFSYFDSGIASHVMAQTDEVAFTISVVIIGACVNFVNLRDFRSSFEKRLSLFRGGQTKDALIDQAAIETIHLERLTMQFSPQVVKAIKAGELTIEDSTRREVTAIFIDIENSSVRSKHIDHSDYEKILKEFFTLVTDVLIKHNITIGTYLGDGILAFANAPNITSKHQLQATRACLDLTEVMLKRRAHFSEIWRAEFNIRIGINSGHASVGFFPNSQFGSYTAIGDSVNLAARLCASAKSNTICVTKDFLKIVGSDLREISAEPCGNLKELKGFQTDDHVTYSLSSTKKASASNECPRCATPLFIKTDLESCVLLNCETCGYSDVREKTALSDQYPQFPTSEMLRTRIAS